MHVIVLAGLPYGLLELRRFLSSKQATCIYSWALHLVVALDDICISRWRALRLTAASLAAQMLRRISRSAGALSALLGRVLVSDTRLLARELSAVGLLLRYSAVVHAALLARWTSMRDNIVCGTLAPALILRHLAVAIIGIGVL